MAQIKFFILKRIYEQKFWFGLVFMVLAFLKCREAAIWVACLMIVLPDDLVSSWIKRVGGAAAESLGDDGTR